MSFLCSSNLGCYIFARDKLWFLYVQDAAKNIPPKDFSLGISKQNFTDIFSHSVYT